MSSDAEWCEALGLDHMSMEDATFIVNHRYAEAIRTLELHRDDLDRLRKVNAQMLEALKTVTDWNDVWPSKEWTCEVMLVEVRAAIKAAEESP